MASEHVIRAVARATCPTRPAGAALHVEGGSTFIGYEGAPHGIAHCDVTGCRLDETGTCRHAVRAELNALTRVARSSSHSATGAVLEISHPLHPSAVGLVINAGVTRVECTAPVARAVQDTLQLAGVTLAVEGETKDADSRECQPKGLEEDDQGVG